MRNRIEVGEPEIINNQRFSTFFNSGVSSVSSVENAPARKILTSEGGESFINYVEWLGLDKDPDLLVLSSMHHYYYDAEEMKNVRTLVNLKELNLIKDIKSFLHSIYHVLPQESYFIGCFVDNKKRNGFELSKHSPSFSRIRRANEIENGIVSLDPFLNMLFSIMDLKTNKYLSRNSVSRKMKDLGFKILDMTELNGLTYLCAQKTKKIGEKLYNKVS